MNDVGGNARCSGDAPGQTGQKVATMFTTDVVGMPSPPHPNEHVGLLGRDFLRYFRFVYDGPSGTYEIIHSPDPTSSRVAHTGVDRATLKA